MNNFETPRDFDTLKVNLGVTIEFLDTMEISQGGPVVGSLSINSRRLVGKFGGPALADETYIYVPMQIRKLFGTSFRLTKINIETLESTFIGELQRLIWLDRVSDDKVYFYGTFDKIKLLSYPIPM
ncbi:hypothetical protein [Pedobacter sp. GR22-6]|uniref:hypothetical protein n=1 Tax=Pedobacter sp. GR22-6 TaxID=3127957 RepID=UPI00307CD7E5